MLQTEFQDHRLFGPREEEFSRFYHIDHFCIKKVRGGLVTGFSNIDYLHTGNQQQRSGRSVYQLFHPLDPWSGST